jgi:crossover junction endodeoxyribonuclease RuvC
VAILIDVAFVYQDCSFPVLSLFFYISREFRMRKTVGLDPGLDGGVAFYSYDPQGSSEFLQGWPMPTLDSGNGKREIDVAALRRLFVDFAPGAMDIALVVLEKVGARPGQGVTSMFSFGTGFGELRGALKWADLRYHQALPQDWKAVVLRGYARKKDKKRRKSVPVGDGVSSLSSENKSETKSKTKTEDKAAAGAFCMARFPFADLHRGPRNGKPHDGVTEAICLAYYGRLLLDGGTVTP